MQTSTLGYAVVDGADVRHDRAGGRYVDLLVDSVPLLDVVGTSTDLVPFLWLGGDVAYLLRELDALASSGDEGVSEGVPVLVCRMCADLECGTVVARVVADGDVVRWMLTEVYFDYSQDPSRVEVAVPGTGELHFNRQAYDEVMAQVRREVTERAVPDRWAGSLGPAEDPSVLRRHLRRHGRREPACPFCADVGDTVVAIMRMEACDAPSDPIEVGEFGRVTDIDRAEGCLPFSRRWGTDEVYVTFGGDGDRWTMCGPGGVLKVTSRPRDPAAGGG